MINIEIDEQEVIELYNSGLLQKHVAEKLVCCQSVISRILTKHGIHRIKTKVSACGWIKPVFDREQMRSLLAEGLTRTEVAEKLGCSTQIIYEFSRKNGIEVNRAQKPKKIVTIEKPSKLEEIQRKYSEIARIHREK